MSDELFRPSEEDLNRVQEILEGFQTWTRDEVGELPVFAVPDLVAMLLLRLRMHLDKAEVRRITMAVLNLVEDHIASEKLYIQLDDGELVPYVSAGETDEDLRTMVIEAATGNGISDADIKHLLEGP